MKKIISLFLAAMLLCSSFLFTACSGNPEENENGKPGEESADVTQADNGDEEDAETTEADTPDDTDAPDEENGLEYDKDSAQARLDALGESEGYEISYKTISTDNTEESYTTGQKGNVWWMLTGDGGNAFVLNGEDGVAMYDLNDGEWTLSSNLVGQNLEGIMSLYGVFNSMYLFMANQRESDLVKVGSDTIVGRACTKYSYKIATLGAAAEWNAYVDDEIGITLKWDMAVVDSGSRGGTAMEVTSFKTGADVSVPDLPEAGEEYMDLTGALGWPENSFTALIPQAPGTVTMSMIQDGKFGALLSDVTADDYAAYITALKDAGFQVMGDEETENTFTGFDKDGNQVEAEFADGQLALTVQKEMVIVD